MKETNNHQFLDYTSCHPKTCKDGIPYSQAKRYRRIFSDDEAFNTSLHNLRGFFMERNFPKPVIDRAFEKVSNMLQSDALQCSVKYQKSVLPFTVMYNPSLPNIGGSIKKYWDLLNLSKDKNVKFVHDNYTPIVAYNRPRNLQDYLVSSKFSTNSDVGSTDSCKRSRCSHCARINTGQSFTSNITGETFKLRHNTNCQTKKRYIFDNL